MKYVEYSSLSGKLKSVDTLENFLRWSNLPAAKGKFRIVKTFDSTTEPEGYKKQMTKDEKRAVAKASMRAAVKDEAPKVTRKAAPTPPEAVEPPKKKSWDEPVIE